MLLSYGALAPITMGSWTTSFTCTIELFWVWGIHSDTTERPAGMAHAYLVPDFRVSNDGPWFPVAGNWASWAAIFEEVLSDAAREGTYVQVSSSVWVKHVDTLQKNWWWVIRQNLNWAILNWQFYYFHLATKKSGAMEPAYLKKTSSCIFL